MTHYQAGRVKEWRTRDLLVEAGYYVVRAAGSKGKVDLVALRLGEPPLLVQCKINGKLGPAEWNELYEVAQRTGGTPVLATTPPRKPITFWLLTGPKVPYARQQPIQEFTL